MALSGSFWTHRAKMQTGAMPWSWPGGVRECLPCCRWVRRRRSSCPAKFGLFRRTAAAVLQGVFQDLLDEVQRRPPVAASGPPCGLCQNPGSRGATGTRHSGNAQREMNGRKAAELAHREVVVDRLMDGGHRSYLKKTDKVPAWIAGNLSLFSR